MDRAACERRVYRLATLLTGDPARAVRVTEAVVRAQPDLRRVDGPRLDRLTVLRSRERPSVRLESDAVPDAVARALAAMDDQSREAWILRRVYRLDPREAARSMDCSKTAGERHLERAEQVLAATVGAALPGGGAEAADAVLEYSLALDVPAIYHVRRRRRTRIRRALRLAIVALVAAAATVIALWWRGRTP